MSPLVFAHDDIDIGIEKVLLNKRCVAEVLLVNNGREIPDYFYHKPTPASLTIEKANVVENLGSLSRLDKDRNLQQSGGRLWVYSKNTYERIPQSMKVSLDFFGEFFDHGGDNNTVIEEIDCVLGIGQIKGEKNLPKFPDIRLSKAYVDPASCHLYVVFQNLTHIALTEKAWDRAGGVFLMLLNLENNIRLADVPLVDIDPQKAFTQGSQVLNWRSPSKINGIKSLRVGVWRVKDDLNFTNNQLDLSVPKACW